MTATADAQLTVAPAVDVRVAPGRRGAADRPAGRHRRGARCLGRQGIASGCLDGRVLAGRVAAAHVGPAASLRLGSTGADRPARDLAPEPEPRADFPADDAYPSVRIISASELGQARMPAAVPTPSAVQPDAVQAAPAAPSAVEPESPGARRRRRSRRWPGSVVPAGAPIRVPMPEGRRPWTAPHPPGTRPEGEDAAAGRSRPARPEQDAQPSEAARPPQPSESARPPRPGISPPRPGWAVSPGRAGATRPGPWRSRTIPNQTRAT